jgi:hypothetical protein
MPISPLPHPFCEDCGIVVDFRATSPWQRCSNCLKRCWQADPERWEGRGRIIREPTQCDDCGASLSITEIAPQQLCAACKERRWPPDPNPEPTYISCSGCGAPIVDHQLIAHVQYCDECLARLRRHHAREQAVPRREPVPPLPPPPAPPPPRPASRSSPGPALATALAQWSDDALAAEIAAEPKLVGLLRRCEWPRDGAWDEDITVMARAVHGDAQRLNALLDGLPRPARVTCGQQVYQGENVRSFEVICKHARTMAILLYGGRFGDRAEVIVDESVHVALVPPKRSVPTECVVLPVVFSVHEDKARCGCTGEMAESMAAVVRDALGSTDQDEWTP